MLGWLVTVYPVCVYIDFVRVWLTMVWAVWLKECVRSLPKSILKEEERCVCWGAVHGAEIIIHSLFGAREQISLRINQWCWKEKMELDAKALSVCGLTGKGWSRFKSPKKCHHLLIWWVYLHVSFKLLAYSLIEILTSVYLYSVIKMIKSDLYSLMKWLNLHYATKIRHILP